MADRGRILGVVLAGGENRRYGDHKALARVGGERIVDRVLAGLGPAADRTVIVANDPVRYGTLGLPVRPDVRPGSGALGGILTGVTWAEEEGFDVALTVACDMPFVPASLLLELAAESDRGSVAAPASPSRRGLEPLCAAYGSGCRQAIERALARGERAIISFYDEVDVRVLPPERVARHGDAERLFLNVNRPEDREEAERMALQGAASTARREREGP